MKKNKMVLTGIFGILLVFGLVLTGCPTDAGDGDPTVDAVTVSPARPGVVKGGTQQFTAAVTGTNNPDQAVTWSVTGNTNNGTAINTSGLLIVAAAETAPGLTVTATSAADPGKLGTAIVTVYASQDQVPTVSAVIVSPATASVVKGGTQQFTAVVAGTNSPDQAVTWSVTGNTNNGTAINTGGLLTVAAGESAASLTVKAASAVDPGKSGTATVTVIPPVSGGDRWWDGKYTYGSGANYVTVNGSTATVGIGGETTQIPNITTEPGGNVLYTNGMDIGDWLYICSNGTRFGIVIRITMGQPGVYGGFNAEGVADIMNDITSYGPTFSPKPSVQNIPGYGWLSGVKQ
jgi:hypothetical protein